MTSRRARNTAAGSMAEKLVAAARRRGVLRIPNGRRFVAMLLIQFAVGLKDQMTPQEYRAQLQAAERVWPRGRMRADLKRWAREDQRV
jgi:hypothetical protein